MQDSTFAQGQNLSASGRAAALHELRNHTNVSESDPQSGERRIFVDPYLPIAEPTRRVQGGSTAPSEKNRLVDGQERPVRSGGSSHGP